MGCMLHGKEPILLVLAQKFRGRFSAKFVSSPDLVVDVGFFLTYLEKSF